MAIRFIHMADIHLGYRQYGSAVRYNDYAVAFEAIAQDAIARRVDFVLLAGDLFHKRSIDPLTLLQATVILQSLREAGIPVLVVQGNHERPHLQETTSWLGYLAELGLLKLVTTRYREGHIVVEPWTPERMEGTYVDLPGGVRVIGVQYFGAATSRVVRDLADALANSPEPRPAYTVLMLHAGLQGILDNYSATLSRAQLEPLRPHVDYIAMGHIHKPFIVADWIHNPGSPETTSMNEVEWTDRGYLVVEVRAGEAPPHSVTVVRSPRRPFIRHTFRVDTYASPQELHDALGAFLDGITDDAVRAAQPVVELDLRGVLAFSRADLDVAHVEEMVARAFSATVTRVKDSTTPSEFDIEPADNLTRQELEMLVLRELVERDARNRDHSQVWSEMAVRLKEMVLAGNSPKEIVAELAEYARLLSEPPAASIGPAREPASRGEEAVSHGEEAVC